MINMTDEEVCVSGLGVLVESKVGKKAMVGLRDLTFELEL